MKISSYDSFSHISDKSTPDTLLPASFIQTTNTAELAHIKLALEAAIETCLTSEQAELINEYYWSRKTKVQIAKERGVVHSTIVKKIKKAETILAKQIDYALLVYRKNKNNFS